MEKQKVECDYVWINFYGSYSYACCIQNTIISENAEIDLDDEYTYRHYKQDVREIKFTSCTIYKIPQGLKNLFPYLVMLEICNSKLKSVELGDLNEYKNLTHINLSFNEIQFLPGNLFFGMKNLQEIRLNDNKIEIIEPNLLCGLEKLSIFNLSGNPCIDKCFDSINKNAGNATLQEIKDEIKQKFSARPFKILFNSRNRLFQTIADLRNTSKMTNDKIQELEEIKQKMAALNNSLAMTENENKDLKDKIDKLEDSLSVCDDKNKNLELQIAELKFTCDTQNNGIFEDLKKVIQNENLRNFAIQVDGEEFKVHKFLLAARSPVLKEMIENNIDAECLNLVNVSKEIFREILNYIYTDEMPQSDDIDFMHLFAATGRLQIEKLKNFAVEKLIQKINAENAIEVLTLANKYENENLQQKAFEIIKNELDGKIADDLVMNPQKLKKLLDFKKEMEIKLEMILNED